MNRDIKIHPSNANGKYYVDQNTCVCSAACEDVAPNNFNYGGEGYGYYVSKQPETPEEETLFKAAMRYCPVEAIYDDGEQ